MTFPTKRLKVHHYEVDQFRRNIHRICIINDGTFSYTVDPPKCVWGFVKTTGRKGSTKTTYHAPINFNKVGEVVDVADTRPYTDGATESQSTGGRNPFL